MMNPEIAKKKLVELLTIAYSGELGAANAYEGHAKSVKSKAEKAEIFNIKEEELEHRARALEMLVELGGEPSGLRDTIFNLIGNTIGVLCHIGGWYIPMYGAGRLERENIAEYEEAARLAYFAGYEHFIEELLHFAEVEWDHELYFRTKVESHFLRHIIRTWGAPSPRESIRVTFEDFMEAQGDIEQSRESNKQKGASQWNQQSVLPSTVSIS